MVRRNPKIRTPAADGEALPQPPRFIAHQELSGRGCMQRLFRRSADPPGEGRLSASEELVMFKRLQYCGFAMSKMWDRLDRLTEDEQQRYSKLYSQYTHVRERIIDANMGLVFNLLGKNRFKNVEFEELRSEGLMALLRAVDTYNPWKGFRFSTYACNSILRSFSRVALMQSKRRHLWTTSFEPAMEPAETPLSRRDQREGLLSERLHSIMNDDSAGLSDKERYVLHQRFPQQVDTRKATLMKIGERMQMSKERVRQIQESALSKLRRTLLLDPILS